jgi:hypothetical protein
MRNVSLAAVAALLSLLAAPCAAAPNASSAPLGQRIMLLAGTPVNVHLVKPLSSGDADVGDTFAIQATDDVIVAGRVVIRKDADGEGSVLSVDRAGSHGHAGSLALGYTWISSVDGVKIALSNAAPAAGSNAAAGAASATAAVSTGAAVAGALAPQALGAVASFAGPLTSVAAAFIHGKNVTVDPSRTLNAFVAAPTQIAAK